MANDRTKGIAHAVFFTLADSSASAQQSLVDDCEKYLATQPGVVHFSAGPRGEAFTREVNDKDFHVALIVIFDSRASHDAYQVHADHLEFVNRNRSNWATVRVFDAVV